MTQFIDDIVQQLVAVFQCKPVDWGKFDSILATIEDINYFAEDDDGTILSKFLLWSECYHCGEAMPEIIRHFIQCGYDVTANNGANGVACLSELCWSSYDKYILDAAKVLLDAGAPVQTYIESADDHDVLDSINWKLAGAWDIDSDWAWANTLEAYYQMISAVKNGKDYHGVDSFEACIGKELTNTEIIADFETLFPMPGRTEFDGSLVFWFDTQPLVISKYVDFVVDKVFVDDNKGKVLPTKGLFDSLLGSRLIGIEFINQTTCYMDFDNGYRIIFSGFEATENERACAFEVRKADTVDLASLSFDTICRWSSRSYEIGVVMYEEDALAFINGDEAVLIYTPETGYNEYALRAIPCSLALIRDCDSKLPLGRPNEVDVIWRDGKPCALRVSYGERYLYIQSHEYHGMEIVLSNELVQPEEPTLLRRLSGIPMYFTYRRP